MGYAAIQIAKALGCRVIATTHRREKLPLLSGVTKALELVGPKTLSDTLWCMEKGGLWLWMEEK